MSDYQKRRKLDYQDRRKKGAATRRAAGNASRASARKGSGTKKGITVKKGTVTKGHNFNVQTESGMRHVDSLTPPKNLRSPDNSITAAPTQQSITNPAYDPSGKRIPTPTDPLTNPTAPTVANLERMKAEQAQAAVQESPSPLPSDPAAPTAGDEGLWGGRSIEPDNQRLDLNPMNLIPGFKDFSQGIGQGFFGRAQDKAGRDIQTSSTGRQIGFAVGNVLSIGLGEGLFEAMGYTAKTFRATSSASKLKLLREWQVKLAKQFGKLDEGVDVSKGANLDDWVVGKENQQRLIGELNELEKATTVLEGHVKQIQDTFAAGKAAVKAGAPEADNIFFKVAQFVERELPAVGNAGDEALQAAQAGRVAVNTATKKKQLSLIERMMGMKGKTLAWASAAVATIASWGWTGHLLIDNVIGGFDIQIRDARIAGDMETSAMVQAAKEDFLDFKWYDWAIYALPGVNVAKAAFVDGVIKQAPITAKATRNLLEWEMDGSGGNTPGDWSLYNQEKILAEKALFDYKSEQIKINQEETRKADLAGAKELAEFHRRNAMLQRHAAKKAVVETAAIWLELAKQKAALDDRYYEQEFGGTTSTYEPPSNLNFGLI